MEVAIKRKERRSVPFGGGNEKQSNIEGPKGRPTRLLSNPEGGAKLFTLLLLLLAYR